jgi:DNA-directed RNA polymerase specialized sigma24 family protein
VVFSRSRRSRIHDEMRAEEEVLRSPTERVEAWARFDEFFQQEHERLFKALYFVCGNRQDAEMRADVRDLLLGLTQRQRAALLLVDLLAYPSEQAGRILGVRPSTVRALATQGRRALRAKEGARDA